ncbi:hypothetical protein DOTSEDRAFT_81418 [Dothistroma septosporum NZE10]|uniref:F-box domain-containing protein n=1 Tax=Dothistroma septosporum (strain NZE10 / CBS 128990) TaxID=675120 RepID=N1PME2_DOTSN|nr:hypothetical protein DOTSEDRAFT_81418 [Dothistroma septosporum NZE10]
MAKRKRSRDKSGRFISEFTTAHQDVALAKRQPASTRTFNINEILEMVLLKLPTRDLLLSQRVCRTWRNTSVLSTHIRRALFLEPAPCGDISYIDWRLDDRGYYSSSVCNLHLGEHLRGPDKTSPPQRYPAHWGKTRGDASEYRIFVNPLLTPIFPVLSETGVYFEETLEDLSAAVKRPEASWRGMTITQPPINCMALEWDSEDSDGDWLVQPIVKAQGSTGICMAGLFDRLVGIGRPAWIQGSDEWETWGGLEDLGKICVSSASSSTRASTK